MDDDQAPVDAMMQSTRRQRTLTLAAAPSRSTEPSFSVQLPSSACRRRNTQPGRWSQWMARFSRDSGQDRRASVRSAAVAVDFVNLDRGSLKDDATRQLSRTRIGAVKSSIPRLSPSSLFHRRSIMMAGAMPPAAHIVTSPRLRSRLSNSSRTVPIRIVPVAPIG